MQLSKQKVYDHSELLSHFSQMLFTKFNRVCLPAKHTAYSFKLEGYMDGPLTFVKVTSPEGEVFTGWAKFNANDKNYTEIGGICLALSRATDKYVDFACLNYVEEHYHTWKINIPTDDNSCENEKCLDTPQGTENKLDPFETPEGEEDVTASSCQSDG